MALHHTTASVVRADIQVQSFLKPKADGQQEEDKFWCDHLENPPCLLHAVPASSIQTPPALRLICPYLCMPEIRIVQT